MPGNFDPSALEGEIPENMDPSAVTGESSAESAEGESAGTTEGFYPFSIGGGKNFGGSMMNGGMGSDDVKLQYIDDDPDSYSNIFNNAKTDITEADQTRLIESLKTLSSGSAIESVVDVEEVLRYFVVHNFVCNGDSYTGSMIHNYYLYEKDGQYFAEFLESVNIEEIIDNAAELIAPYVEKDPTKFYT